MTEETAPELTSLDPAWVTATRIASAIGLLPFLIGAGVLESFQLLPPGSIFMPVILIYAWLVVVLPARKYRHWGYAMLPDRLRIVRGYMFSHDTVVPLGRIQHIDVDQGPIDRKYGLATLTVHTAGNHNSTVSLPGLLHADAVTMRETIRSHIREDLV